MAKLDVLRKKHSRFVYQGFSTEIKGKDLLLRFVFKIEPDIHFRPEIRIKNIDISRVKKIDKDTLNNLVFHLGLMEIPSYWKTTCSQEILIEAGYLNIDQIKWWQTLIFNGMGQFFYENKIKWQAPRFVVRGPASHTLWEAGPHPLGPLKERYLVPMGGGKDSIVTLESLKKKGKKVNCFSVNPTMAAKEVMRVAGIKNPIIIERKIDPKLLELNRKGYLNGHTPFTALLSFLSVFAAVLFGYKNIAFSNEKSADEGNIKYLGKTVNHQYSKSSDFEKKFKKYSRKFLAKNVNYFSYLRPHTELEISKMFVKHPKYFPVFSSCNIAGKIGDPPSARQGRWCNKCPKCLFVYMMVHPFLKEKQLLKIFEEDLFNKKDLLPTLKDILGQGKHKPFECVGTKKESKLAFSLCLKKAQKLGKIPHLLRSQ